jgi:hypothetical protein
MQDNYPLDPELERIVPLAEAARLRGSSIDTLERQEPDRIVQISPGRRGMRLKNALLLGEEKSITPSPNLIGRRTPLGRKKAPIPAAE